MRLIDADAFDRALADHEFTAALNEASSNDRAFKAIPMLYSTQSFRDVMKNRPTVAAIPVEWLENMQQESLSENDRTMVGAIEAIFIEWHIYVNRLREMSRQKEQEAQETDC